MGTCLFVYLFLCVFASFSEKMPSMYLSAIFYKFECSKKVNEMGTRFSVYLFLFSFLSFLKK